MTARNAIRLWPPVGVVAMLLLGWMVGPASTPVDEAVLNVAHGVLGQHPSWLLVFTDWWLLGPVLAGCLVVALCRRQWRLAAAVSVSPVVAIAINEAVKRLFKRHNPDCSCPPTTLEYPSGHITSVVVVMGMLVLVAGWRLWAVGVAAVVSLLAIVGEIACRFHYFTDTVGGVLLGSAAVCLAVRLAGSLPAPGGSPLVSPPVCAPPDER